VRHRWQHHRRNVLRGAPVVNIDATAYLEYEGRNVVGEVVTADTLVLMQINPDSSSSSTLLSATTQNETQYPGNIIPDGNGGVLATWSVSVVQGTQPTYPYEAVDFSGGVVGTPYNLPFSPQAVNIAQQPDLILGENGVAFASGMTTATVNGTQTQVSQIASFNISSGEPNWTYQGASGTTLSLIEATAGNGLAAKSTDQTGTDTVLIFSPGGTESGMVRRQTKPMGANSAAPADSSGLSQTDYYSNGLWVGASGGGATAEVGLLIQAAMSSFPHEKGNQSKQSSAPPQVVNFEANDPAPPNLLTTGFQQRYASTQNLKNVSLSTLTYPVAFVGQYATWDRFQKDLLKPISAVAFIGHSLDSIPPAPVRAIGLCFFNAQCVERQTVPGDFEYCVPVGCFLGYSDNPPVVNNVDYPAPPIVSQAKIIFISACNMDVNMQAWLGVNSNATGRALVVPQSTTDVDLDMGEYEWLQILHYLTSGQNLQQAVANANNDVAHTHGPWYNNSQPPQQVQPQAWQVIGDSGNGGAGIHF
jgi:hypothetical protein